MRGLVVALALVVAQIGAGEALGAGAPQPAGPRVVLGFDAKSKQRYVQLTDRGPVYPTADVSCDGNRRTITLTSSGNVGDRTVSTYTVPPKVSEVMLKSAECRLMVPGREITLARQQIRSAWSGPPRAQKP
jgi:hypothetical protein